MSIRPPSSTALRNRCDGIGSTPSSGRLRPPCRGRALAATFGEAYRRDFAQPSSTKNPSMTKVRINYDGWLSLPTAVRQKLGLSAGDQLTVELSGGSIVLRPVRSGTT